MPRSEVFGGLSLLRDDPQGNILPGRIIPAERQQTAAGSAKKKVGRKYPSIPLAWTSSCSTAGSLIQPTGRRTSPDSTLPSTTEGSVLHCHHGRDHIRHHAVPVPHVRHRRSIERRQSRQGIPVQRQSPARRGHGRNPIYQAQVLVHHEEQGQVRLETYALQVPPGSRRVPEGVQPAEESQGVLFEDEEAVRLIHQEPQRDDATQRGLDEDSDPEHASGGERGG